MADQDSGHSYIIMKLLRHVTSSPEDANVKAVICRRIINPPSLVVKAFIGIAPGRN